MNTKNHHEFTLWIHSEESFDTIPALIFDEGNSFDEILLTMLSLDQLGLYCTLSCDTWSEIIKDESEDVKND